MKGIHTEVADGERGKGEDAEVETASDADIASAGAELAVRIAATTSLGAWARSDMVVKHEYLDHTADMQIHSWGR